MDEQEIERYVDAFNRIAEKVDDVASAAAILAEVGKTLRMREMRDVERREFSGSANGDDRPATSKQKAFLKSLGGEVSDGLTKAEASRRIDELTNGRE